MTQNSKDAVYTLKQMIVNLLPNLSPRQQFPFPEDNHYYVFSASPYRNTLVIYKHIGMGGARMHVHC